MAASVKQMLEAADAALLRITLAQACEMIAQGHTLIVDVRDTPELKTSEKVPRPERVARHGRIPRRS